MLSFLGLGEKLVTGMLPGALVAPPPRQPDAMPAPVKPWVHANLYQLAADACDNPEGLRREHMWQYLLGFPDGDGDTHGLGEGSPNCMKELYREMMGYNKSFKPDETLRWEWVIYKAKDLRMKYEAMRWPVWDNMFQLANQACADPDSVTPEQLRYRQYGFPNGDGNVSGIDGNPSSCVRQMFRTLMGLNASWPSGREIDYGWFYDKARELKRTDNSSPPGGTPSPDNDPEPSNDRRGRGYNPCLDPGNTCFKGRMPGF